jgi:hypothetical protein
MKECKKCGNFIPDDVRTCPHCGGMESLPVLVMIVMGFLVAAGGGVYALSTQKTGVIFTLFVVFLMVTTKNPQNGNVCDVVMRYFERKSHIEWGFWWLPYIVCSHHDLCRDSRRC